MALPLEKFASGAPDAHISSMLSAGTKTEAVLMR